jgi:hypothetical protein
MFMRNDRGYHLCKSCGYQTKFKQSVVRHIEARHLNKKIACKFCDLVSNTSRNLQRHIQKMHFHDNMDIKQVMTWHND